MNEDNDDDELFARVRRPAPHDENTDFFAAPLKEVAIPLTKETSSTRPNATMSADNGSTKSQGDRALPATDRCHECGLILGSMYLRSIHETEEHSPFFDGKYQCLVQGCEHKKFKSETKRYWHLIGAHAFPKEFAFPKRPPGRKAHSNSNAQKKKQDKKSILCRYVKNNEPCPHGDECFFAHDKADTVPKEISFGRKRRPVHEVFDAHPMDFGE